GNVLTASTHIITVVVGAGVLALAWAMAQLGWIAGIGSIVTFSAISIFTYSLVADCYRYPDPVTGQRNYTYMQAVKAYLGGRMHVLCGLVQYTKLAGITVGYTITSSTSLVAIRKAICFHNAGKAASCKFSNNPFMIGFGILQIFLSQIPNFHELTWLSTAAAITSFGYVFIGSGLCLSVVLSEFFKEPRLLGPIATGRSRKSSPKSVKEEFTQVNPCRTSNKSVKEEFIQVNPCRSNVELDTKEFCKESRLLNPIATSRSRKTHPSKPLLVKEEFTQMNPCQSNAELDTKEFCKEPQPLQSQQVDQGRVHPNKLLLHLQQLGEQASEPERSRNRLARQAPTQIVKHQLDKEAIKPGRSPNRPTDHALDRMVNHQPGKGAATSITGTKLPVEDKLLKVFTAMGNIALACTYATVVYDIMDTLKSHPAENKQMKRANVLGVTAMTILFLLCSGLGYAAFGDNTPGNILTGFTEPFWLVALGNGCIVMHMIGAYQVMGQPFFRIVEMGANMVWPHSDFINKEYSFMMGNVMVRFNLFRLVWRTIFVIFATVLAMVMPFFSEVLSLLGAIGFGPLVVFFPIQMHIAQKQIRKLSLRWYCLQFLSCLGFIISVTAVIGSIHGIIQDFHKTNLFMYKQ
ncbi:hypothetical protein LR48_Vigan07g213100, partial [Vigna angularis]